MAQASGGPGASEFADFPLWKDVPGRSFAVLRGGWRNGTHWSAFVSRPEGSREGRINPCIIVARITREGRYTDVGGCGLVAPAAGADLPPINPLIGEAGASYLAMSFATDVVRVELGMEPGGTRVMRPKLLSRAQARKARVARFRYIAESVPFDACIEEIVGFDRYGDKILDATTGDCPLLIRG